MTDSEGNSETGEVTVTIRDWSVSEDSSAPVIYPNPSNGHFAIDVKGKYSYRLFNSVGQQVILGEGEGKTFIDGTALSQGVYFLQLTVDGTWFEKVVIEK